MRFNINKKGILLLIPLFITFSLPQIFVFTSNTDIIYSHGTINYGSNDNRLYGVILISTGTEWENYGEWLTKSMVDKIAESGANLVKIMLNGWAWKNNIQLPSLGITYQDRINQIVEWFNDSNINVIIEVYILSENNKDWEGKWQTKAEFIMGESNLFTHAEYYRMLNEISGLDIYAIGPFNEPPYAGKTTYSDDELFNQYWDLIVEAVRQIHNVNPNIIVNVESCPFWDLKPMIDNPIPEPNVIYEVHTYQIDRAVPEVTEAITQGNLLEAERLYKLFILERNTPEIEKIGLSIRLADDAGLKVYCGECGTNTYQTAWNERMQWHYKLMDELGIDFVQLSYYKNYGNSYNYGMLTRDGSNYNEVGELWRNEMMKNSNNQ